MRSMKMLLIVGAAVSVVAAACGGSTTNSGGGNEGDSGSGSGSSSGSSSGSGSGSSSGAGSSSGSGSGSSSGSSSGGQMGDGGLTCTPTSCGASGLCCVGFGMGGGTTSMCVTGSMCPMGSRQLCDPSNPMCPAGETCRMRMGSMYGTCRAAMDGGGMGGEGGMMFEAGAGD